MRIQLCPQNKGWILVAVGSSTGVKPSQGCHLLFSFQSVPVDPLLLAPCFKERSSHMACSDLNFSTKLKKRLISFFYFFSLLDNALNPILHSLRKTVEATRQFQTNERAS